MRELFTIDLKDYDPNAKVKYRPSARAIIRKGNLIALVFASKKGYYKFPGGGINGDESNIEALIREVREEAGLDVDPDSITEYGYVIRRQKSSRDDGVFEQVNYYYVCSCSSVVGEQELDDYEAEDGFVLQWVDVGAAAEVNLRYADETSSSLSSSGDLFDRVMAKREGLVLEMLAGE